MKRYNDVNAFLYLILASDMNISSVVFSESDGRFYVNGQNDRFFTDPMAFTKALSLLDSPGQVNEMIVYPSHEDKYFFMSNNKVFTMARNYLDLSMPLGREDNIGTLFININVRAIDELFRQLDIYQNGEIIVKDSGNNLIYANHVYYDGNFRGPYFEISRTCKMAPWTIMIRMNHQKVQGNIFVFIRVFCVFIALILASLLVISYFYSKSFSSFISKIRRKEAELGSLKSIIKPHYLYNTLEIIRMNAINNDDHSTAELVTNLAEQMRLSIAETKEMVFLDQELEMIRSYFVFIDMSYDHRVTWAITCDDELRPALVLSLMIQPIVENAVIHGIKPKGKGHVEIKVERKGRNLLVKVQDDGVGMEAGAVKHLAEQLEKNNEYSGEDRQYDTIGLKNVHDRIRCRFGESFGITMESSPQKGTAVIILLPRRGRWWTILRFPPAWRTSSKFF
jgi:two-component system sensor histidine kinase YesM